LKTDSEVLKVEEARLKAMVRQENSQKDIEKFRTSTTEIPLIGVPHSSAP